MEITGMMGPRNGNKEVNRRLLQVITDYRDSGREYLVKTRRRVDNVEIIGEEFEDIG
jgi:hypothetical protein